MLVAQNSITILESNLPWSHKALSKIFHFVTLSTWAFIVIPDEVFWAREQSAASCPNTDVEKPLVMKDD